MTRQGAARRSIKTTYQLNFYQTLLALSSGFVFLLSHHGEHAIFEKKGE
jgi:hypothetical protein